MRARDLFLVLLVVALWGMNFVVIKIGLKEMSPLSLCFARFFFTSIPAVFFVKRPNVPFSSVASYGLIMFALQFSLLFIGLNIGMPAGLASVLLQTNVFFTLLLAIFFLNERPRKWQLLGAFISFSGIAMIGMHVGGDMTLAGFLLVIAAAFFWGLGSLISKKMGKVGGLSLVVWGSLVAWPPLLLVAIVTEGGARVISDFSYISFSEGFSISYIVIFSTLIGFALWNRLLLRYPIALVAPFTLLVPVFGLLSSSLVLGEVLTHLQILSILLIVSGLIINLTVSKLTATKVLTPAEESL